MKLFRCQACGNLIHFENRVCGRCGHRLGYLPELQALSALEPAGEPKWTPLAAKGAQRRFCASAEQDACNWLTPLKSDNPFCLACLHNETIPNLSAPQNLQAWRDIELAKHRLFYSLLRWRLPLTTRAEDPEHGLVFKFLADPPAAGPKVMTGHDNGVITIALSEADSAERERRRSEMGEPYRTLLGHFRHEVGHYFWDVLGATAVGSRRVARSSATSARITARRSSDTMPRGHSQTGASALSQPMRRRTPGRISRRLGRITCKSSIRWTRRPNLA